MNEFIVWDKEDIFGESRAFWSVSEILANKDYEFYFMVKDNFDIELSYYNDDADFGEMVIVNIDTFNYAGKTDIEGNKIYADSSIVEFGHKNNHSPNAFKLKGVFKFNTKELRYFIECFTGHKISYDSKQNFKIIDTLQENKLGLIGDKNGKI